MDNIEISVVAPCYNEEGNIELLCKRVKEALSPLGVGFELICVDDASTDSTKSKIDIAEKKNDFVIGAYHKTNQGIVEGWRTGLNTSHGKYVATIDADLQYRPEDIVEMYYKAEQSKADLVQGWRQVQVERSLLRRFFTWSLSALLNLIFWMNLKDNKSGYILYRRDAFIDILGYKSNFRYFQHFITIAAIAKGYKIVQIPVTFDKRHSGESFIASPLKFSYEAAIDIPKAIYEYRLTNQKKKLEG